MTHEQRNQKILDTIKRETKKALESKEYARKMLIKEGIYNEEGQLMPEFGGEAALSA